MSNAPACFTFVSRCTLWMAIAGFSFCQSVSNTLSADIVFNTFEPNAAFVISSTDDLSHHAETFQIDDSLAPTKPYRIDALEPRVRLVGPRLYENLTATVKFWGSHNGNSSTNVFSNLLSEVTFSFGDVTVNNSADLFEPVFDYAGTGNSFILPANQTLGVEIDWTDDADSKDIQNFMAISAVPPDIIGSSTFGIYLDTNDDDMFSSDEFVFSQFSANLQLRIQATAIPEPSTFGILVILLLLLLGFCANRDFRRTRVRVASRIDSSNSTCV